MKAEIIGVGTELLLGQIANTNAQRISAALASIGVDVYFHGVVGDNVERVSTTLAHALERSDVAILTGGLGPTPDDVTREAVAHHIGHPLVRDERLVQKIRDVFAGLNRPMPEENLRQADLPEGAVAIEAEGTAPGFYVERGGRLVIALPGVPWEMQAMLDKTVLPLLRERSGDAVIVSRQVLVIGLGESLTHQKIADIVDAQSNPTIAYLAGGGQVRVRITAKADSEAAALESIAPVEREIRDRLGVAAVEGNHATLARALGAMLEQRNLTVAAAESLTGGLIGAQLTEQPGSGEYFVGSLVCYSNGAKRDVAGIDASILDGPGPVSEECARALAEAAASRFGADLGLSATGVAGPDPHEGHPMGTVFVGAAFGGHTEVRRIQGYGDRENIRNLAVTAALDLGRRAVMGYL